MLTDRNIANAKPRTKLYKLSDRDGLYLGVTPTGARSWRYDFRLAGQRKTHTYGLYPDVSLAEARELHSEARKLVARGLDPVQVKKNAKQATIDAAANTFRAIAESWYAELAPHRSPSWLENNRRWLDERTYPALGNKIADNIEPDDVLKLIRGIAEEGYANTAECVRRMASRVFRYGGRNRRCKTNPAELCEDVIVVPSAVHHRPLSVKELPGFLKMIDTYTGDRRTVLAADLLLLTMTRKSELIGARWSELDLDADEPVWRIGGQRMKMRSDHMVPLSQQAADAFRELKPLSCGSEFVFPNNRRLDRHMCKTTLNRMFERKNIDVTPHGIRATASTVLNESGLFRSDVIERALAHVEPNKSRAAYNAAQYLPERREMLEWWAEYLHSLRHNGNVVPFKRTA